MESTNPTCVRTNRGQQLAETRPVDATGRAPEIVVDQFHHAPAQRLGAIDQRILKALALQIVLDLISR